MHVSEKRTIPWDNIPYVLTIPSDIDYTHGNTPYKF